MDSFPFSRLCRNPYRGHFRSDKHAAVLRPQKYAALVPASLYAPYRKTCIAGEGKTSIRTAVPIAGRKGQGQAMFELGKKNTYIKHSLKEVIYYGKIKYKL